VGVSEAFEIRVLERLDERQFEELSEVLIDCVEGGASVSFLLPMTAAKARVFWRATAARLAHGELRLLAACDGSGTIVGTVQLLLKQAENQPHRADVAKMLVHSRARQRGVGAALLAAAERAALGDGRTVLVLDTASAEAARLYERNGWQRCGRIPRFALWPDGSPCETVVYYKILKE
jgi:GNAT superfamily N-acetyltransferase